MKIGVYGLGRFGYFWSELLGQKFEVYGYNRTLPVHKPKNVSLVSENKILQCDVLFLCVSISSLESVLLNISDRIKPGCLVFDTCSVKVYPVNLMKSILKNNINIIATHPMFGPDSGKNSVKDLPIVFIPVRDSGNFAKFWKNIFLEFEMRVIEITAEIHDKDAAFTQGVTHFIGRVLNELDLKESEIATTGYKSLLALVEQTCNDPLQLFMDLQHFNPYTHNMRQELNDSLKKTMDMLANADPEKD
ncbi:MAG: prephenate dehydrogenase/arogenate dehydrogenase family protein [Spirochaetes bacterium]|nr:MAG: prephenate dehydrogenase/arogenate dehydrogenase family protein [Spirochaetota bacterium]